MLAVVVLLADRPSAPTLVALGLGAVVAPASYRTAVLATDECDAAVRALVDLGRPAVAEAIGLAIPTDFTAERHL